MKVVLENDRYTNNISGTINKQTACSIEKNNREIVEHKPAPLKKNTSVNSSTKNKLMLVMQDYKNGHITRKREYNSEGKSNEPIITLNKADSNKYINNSETLTATMKTANATAPEVSKPTNQKHSSRKLVFKSFLYPNLNVAHNQSESVFLKGLNNRGTANKKTKIHKPLKYVERSLWASDQANLKPTFKLTKPPLLEQKRPDQASLMGLFPSKLNK